MEFLVLLFIGWILWSIVGNAARNADAKKLPPPAFYDPSQVPPQHVLHVVPAPAALLPARVPTEESSSELLWDEVEGDTELDEPGLQVVSLESTAEMSVEARPMPGEAVTLEQEVDWEQEHELFHRKYVDGHSTGSAARHGLLDEMRDPGAVRRAVLMAEILGPPKSLRK
jgi:hypothetical protein